MPPAQNDGEFRIPFLDGASDFHRLTDHRSGHKRDTKAEGITYFFEHALFVVWSDGGIDEANLDIRRGARAWQPPECPRAPSHRNWRTTGRRKQFCGTWATRTPRLNRTIGPSLSAVVTWMSAVCNVFPFSKSLLLNRRRRQSLPVASCCFLRSASGYVTGLSLPCHFLAIWSSRLYVRDKLEFVQWESSPAVGEF